MPHGSRRTRLAGAGLGCLLLSMACPPGVLQANSDSLSLPVSHEDDDLSDLLVRVDHELAEIDALLASSHFHAVLSVAQRTRDLLSTLEGRPELDSRWARLEVMAATAEIALGRRAVAQRSMLRALRAESGLSLDASETSPKVLRLLREARRRSALGQPEP